MATAADRLKELANEHLDLGHEPDLDAKFSDSGVSSVDAVAFIRVVNQDFNITIPPEQVAGMETLRDLAAYLDTNSG